MTVMPHIAHRAQQRAELRGLGVVEPGRRLVEQQKARPRHQGAHDFEQFLRAHRQVGRGHVAETGKADEFEQRVGARRERASSRRAAGSHSICSAA